jgi:hypothetical protein
VCGLGLEHEGTREKERGFDVILKINSNQRLWSEFETRGSSRMFGRKRID